MLLKKIMILSGMVALMLLGGCQGEKLYQQTEGNIADVVQHTTEARQQSDQAAKRAPALVMNEGFYIDKTPIRLAEEPSWLKNRIILRGVDLPFSYYSRMVANGGSQHVLTRYQTGLNASKKISMNYSGSVKGALDLLATKTGYSYTVNRNNIDWQAFITKTFDIAFMPGSSDYMMGKASGNTSNTSSAGNGGPNQPISAVIDDSASSQYSNMKATLSVWKDLTASIAELLSPEGKVMVSEATTSVTVRDRPSNVELVTKFITNFNRNLSKQVLVKVQVLSIKLNTDYNFGIDWNIVHRAFQGGDFVLNANDSTPVSITATNDSAIPKIGFRNAAASIFIKALNQQGKVSVVTEPRVVCLNNQVSAIRILMQEGYLASVQNTTNTSSLTPFVTTQLTPGILTTGLTLYLLPKIIDDKIIMQVNADLSASLGIKTISSATGGHPTDKSAIPGSVIQVPNLTQKQFNQRSVIHSGETLILSGFRQVANQANASQLFGIQALGGKGAAQVNEEIIVLITPTILHGFA